MKEKHSVKVEKELGFTSAGQEKTGSRPILRLTGIYVGSY